MSEPTPPETRPAAGSPALSGTLRYGLDDYQAARSAFVTGKVMTMWQGALAVATFGLVIGWGAIGLIRNAVGPELADDYGPWLDTGWAAYLATAALAIAGAIRLGRGGLPKPDSALWLPQQFVLDAAGLATSSDDGESLTRWQAFAAWTEKDGRLHLRSKADMVFTLPRAAFASDADYRAARTMIAARVAELPPPAANA